MVNKNFVYSRIGMALVSAQRVEFITSKLLEFLTEFDHSFYGLTTTEFLETSSKSKGNKTLGHIFKLLKLNPKLVIEDELTSYLEKRNLLAHNFWATYLSSKSDGTEAVEFCYDFGKHSTKLESFFKGLTYLLALKYVKNRENLDEEIKKWSNDFDFFMESVLEKKLK